MMNNNYKVKNNRSKLIRNYTLISLILLLMCPVINAEDWPCRLHDAFRTGICAEEWELTLTQDWVHSDSVPSPAWPETPYVDGSPRLGESIKPRRQYDMCYNVAVVNGLLYYGSSSTGEVICLNTVTGQRVWTFFTDGPVRFAPHVSAGKIFVGSDDGYIYCLNAADGSLVWKESLAPDDRTMFGNGQMMSICPVRGSPVVDSSEVFWTAGMLGSSEGMYICKRNAADGTGGWTTDAYRPPEGYLTVDIQCVIAPGGKGNSIPYWRASGLKRKELGAYRDGGVYTTISPPRKYFYLSPGNNTTKQYDVTKISAMTALFDDVFYLVYDTDNTHFFGVKNSLVQKIHHNSGDIIWSKSYSYPYSIIRVGSLIFAGGDGEVAAMNASDGTRVWTQSVDGKAWGLAASDGRLFISTDQGSIYCYNTGGSVNNPPVANDDNYNVEQDTTLNVSAPGVLNNDVDTDPITAILVTDVNNGTLTLNSDGSFDYTPNAGYTGTDSFTYKANDGEFDSNNATVTINVTGPVVNTPPVANADSYGMVKDTTLNIAAPGVLNNDDDADSDPLTAILVSDVSHGFLTLNSDGSFDYTPNAGYTGDDSFTYKANDGEDDSNNTVVTITISDVSDIRMETGTVSVGGTWTTVNLANTYISPVVFCVINYNNSSTPIVPRVQNASGNMFDVKLQSPSGNPVVTETVHYIVVEEGAWQLPDGRNIEASLVLSDAVNDDDNWAVSQMEAYIYQNSYIAPVVLGQVMTENDTSWSVFWTCGINELEPPDATTCYVGKHVGEDTDLSRADETLGVIVIESGNGTILGTPYETAVGPATVQAFDNATPPPFTYTLSSFSAVPEIGIICQNAMNAMNGSWAYMYGANPISATELDLVVDEDQIEDSERKHGAEQIAYIVFESSIVLSGQVSTNEAPVANNDSYNVDQDTTLNITAPGVLGNDTDAESDPLTAVLVTDVANGTLTLNSDGSFSYTPNAGYVGSDSFTYKANDGTSDSNNATVTITVIDVPEAPTANADSYQVNEDTTLNISAPGVLGNDTDPENDPLTAILVSDVANGTLTLNSDGSFSYTPDAGYIGGDSFTYKANDGGLDSNNATVTITVLDVPEQPVANADSYQVDQDTTLNISAPGVLGNDTDPENDPLTAILVTDVVNGTLTLNSDGSFSYTPDAGYVGSDSFTYKANDGGLDSNNATVTITVLDVPEPPVANADSYDVDQDTTLNISAPGVLGNDTDPENDPLNAILVTDVANGTLTLNSDGSFTYTPDAGYTGSDSFTYKANDGGLDSNNATVTITVIDVPEAPTANADSYQVDQDTTLNIAAPGVLGNDTDPENDPLTAILVTDVANGTLTLNSDGSFSYTPDAGYVGSDSFTYKANDGGLDSNNATVTITVLDVPEPPVANADSYQVDQDTTLNVAAPGVLGNDTDPENDPLTAVLVTDVANGTLTLNSDGSFSYTPDAGYVGSDSFTYKANDGGLDSNNATVTITVLAVPQPPIANDDSYQVDQDTTLNVAAPGVLGNDTDINNDPLTAILVTDVANGTLTLNSDGSFSYTPDAGYVGSDSFTYKANDGGFDSNNATVTITVLDVPEPPVANADNYQVDQDTTLNISAPGVLGNDTDPENDSLTAILVTDVANGTLTLNSDGSFSYTPDAGYVGSDSFTYKANDGGLDSNDAIVTITVLDVPEAPVANADSYQVDEDTTLNISAPGVLGNDTDPENDPLTAILVTDVANGTLTLNSDGSFIYTPNAGYIGNDSFTYKANDGGLDSNDATVTITVIDVPEAPTANADSYDVDQDTTLNVSAPGVLGNDTDPENDPLTAILVTDVANGTLTLNSDGSFSYTPNAGYVGSDSFTYKANDGGLDSNDAIVTITVLDVPEAPTANADSYQVDQDTTLNVAAPGVLGNDTDPENDPLTAILVTDVANGTLTLNSDGSFSYTPNAGYTGTDSFTYKANDGGLDSNNATVTITVNAVVGGLKLESGTISIGDTWTAVTLNNSYDSPVVICAVNYNNNTVPVVSRVRNAAGNSFETKLQSPAGNAIVAETVHYMVVEEGVWQLPDGRNIEALKVLSDGVTENDTFYDMARMELYTYQQSYTTPVVLGQVMTENDTAWSVFWTCNGNELEPPDATTCYVGKHVGEDPNNTRANETLGVIVIEAGNGTIDGTPYEAQLGPETVKGIGNTPPFAYTLSGFSAAPQVGVVCQNAMDGPNGSWIYLYGASPLSISSMDLAADEDIVFDTERGHTAEQAAYLVFESPVLISGSAQQPPTANDDSYQVDQDTTLNVAAPGVLGNDTDPESDPLTAILDTDVVNGALTLNSDGSFDYTPNAGYTGSDSFTYKANDGNLNSNIATVTITVNSVVPQIKMETGKATVDNNWTAITLSNTYTSPVVVCIANYNNNTIPVLCRVRNAAGNTFEVKLQNPSGTAVSAETVHYMVVEEGVWQLPDGRNIEAARVVSDGVNSKGSADNSLMEAYTYQQSYTSPVVLGQVMTENDANWSIFWSSDGTYNDPPDASTCYVGKHVGEDPNKTRADETLGVIVIEAGSGSINGVLYEVAVGSDSLRGIDNGPPFDYSLSSFTAVPEIGIVCQSAMDGADGSWACLYGASPLSAAAISITLDEDQLGDSERKHTTEQGAYIVFESAIIINGGQ